MRSYWAVIFAALVIAFVSFALPYYIHQQSMASHQNADAIRTILCYFESLAPKHSAHAAEAARIYRHALALIHEPACTP